MKKGIDISSNPYLQKGSSANNPFLTSGNSDGGSKNKLTFGTKSNAQKSENKVAEAGAAGLFGGVPKSDSSTGLFGGATKPDLSQKPPNMFAQGGGGFLSGQKQ